MGKLKGFLALLLLFAVIYAGFKLIPPYVNNYSFQDELDDIARRASYSSNGDDDVRAKVIRKAASMDIPLKEDQITVTHMGDSLGITVQYRVHVDMLIHPVDMDFTVNSLNKRI
jgi:hypothetical protein